MAWYNKSVEEVIRELNTDVKTGITEENAAHRLERYGDNSLGAQNDTNILKRLSNTVAIPAVLLIVAAALCFFSSRITEGAVILALMVLRFALEVYMDEKARAPVTLVKRLTAPSMTVLRDSRLRLVGAEALVPGDVVILRAGDIISADMRVIEAFELISDESALPGGYEEIHKTSASLLGEDIELAARPNMLYRGAVITSGSGQAIVVETGKSCEGTAHRVAPEGAVSALRKIVGRQNGRISAIIYGSSLIVLLCALFLQEMGVDNLTRSIIMALILATAATPCAFLTLEALALSGGIKRLAARGILVKSTAVMENMGVVNKLLVNKTGIVTSDEMTATMVWAGGKAISVRGRGWAPDGRMTDADGETIDVSENHTLALTLIAGALCNNSEIEELGADVWIHRGDPTECALITLAAKAGLFKADLNETFVRVAEFPFNPTRRMMTTVHTSGRKVMAYAKGSPEAILSRCENVMVGTTAHALSENLRAQIENVHKRMVDQGMRVIAVAYREVDGTQISPEFIEKSFNFCGLVGIDNRVRPESVAAYNILSGAGVGTIITTGDREETAIDLALSLGMPDEALTGGEISGMSPDELREALKDTGVCAEADPEVKRIILTALTGNDYFVAATGRYATDAAALRAAGVGISVGSDSREITREAADMILEDAELMDITNAFEEGRKSFASFRSFLAFTLACAIAELLSMFLLIVLKIPAPFTPLGLLWINIMVFLIPAFTLGTEVAERDMMRRTPRAVDEPPVRKFTVIAAIIKGLALTGVTIGAFFLARSSAAKDVDAIALAQSAAFVTFVIGALFAAHSSRSESTGLFRLGIGTNKSLLLLSVGIIAMLLLAVYVPALNEFFGTMRLGVVQWLLALAGGILVLACSELYKAYLRPLLKDSPGRYKGAEQLSFSERLFSKFEGDDPTQEDVPSLDRKRRKRAKPVKETVGEVPEPETAAPESSPIPDTVKTETAKAEAIVEAPQQEIVKAAAVIEEPRPELVKAETASAPQPDVENETAIAEAPRPDPIVKPVEPAVDREAFLKSLPEELRPYSDLLSNLPPELLHGTVKAPEAEVASDIEGAPKETSEVKTEDTTEDALTSPESNG